MDLSFIIPVYNVEDYIVECLQPLTQLKKYKFEIILVNDGSQDKSIPIVETFSGRLPLKIIHQENGGASKARNRGLKEAKGKFIYFYDSDDFLIPNQFEKLLTQAIEKDLDICSGKGMLYTESGTLTPIKKDESTKLAGILSGPEMFKLMDTKKEYSSMIWLRLFKQSFLEENKIGFTEEIIHEDEEFTALCFAHAKTTAYFPLDFYRYRYREGSVSKSIRHKYLNPKSIPAFSKIAQQLLKNSIDLNGKEVILVTISKCVVEILRRLEYQKQVGIIKKIPSWEKLNLKEILKSLPMKYRLPIYRYRFKLYFK